MSYSQRLAIERRRVILQVLIEEGGQSNERSLFIALRAMGHSVGLEQAGVRKLLADLETRACLTTEMYDDVLMVARITDRGRLVVAGDIRVDGVAPPSPVV